MANTEGLKQFSNKLFEKNRIIIMGILNATPDSFYDGGKHFSAVRAVEHAGKMIAEGADIIDIGGESTRPGAEPLPAGAETERVLPVISEAVRAFPEIRDGEVLLSIDTYKAAVAREALKAGVSLVNDISALSSDPEMPETVKNAAAYAVLMHMQGTPKNMQANPVYDNIMKELMDFFSKKIHELAGRGIPREKLILDPGIGFGKTRQHNIEILSRLELLTELGCPLMIGASRKSFIGRILGTDDDPLPAEERLEGSLAASAVSAAKGAKILRVHDVKETKRFLKVLQELHGIY